VEKSIIAERKGSISFSYCHRQEIKQLTGRNGALGAFDKSVNGNVNDWFDKIQELALPCQMNLIAVTNCQ
jgi:hypothetical protein